MFPSEDILTYNGIIFVEELCIKSPYYEKNHIDFPGFSNNAFFMQ